MKKIGLLCISLLLVLTACGQKELPKSDLVIKHDLGETEIKSNPEKVVIFDLGILDMYQSLGLSVGGVPQDDLTDNLKEYKDSKYMNAGTLFEPLFEELAEYAPDLIIISGRAADSYDELSKIAPTIALNMDNKNFMGSLENRLNTLKEIYPQISDVVDKEIEDLKQSVYDLKEKAESQDKQTLFVLANGDSISIYGPKSRFGMIYDDFGFKPLNNVTYEESRHGQQVSFEFVAEHNPDTIIVMDRVAATGQEALSGKDLLNNDLVNMTSAVKNDEVLYVNPFIWYIETGGLNSTKTMIEELQSIVE